MNETNKNGFPDKIYLIVSGEYSDYRVEGFSYSEEEANEICDMYNKCDIPCSNDYRVKVCGKIFANKINVLHEYSFSFVKCEDGYRENADVRDHEIQIHKKSEPRKPPYILGKSGSYKVWVWIYENDNNKALKIAQDALYKYLAEKEGL